MSAFDKLARGEIEARTARLVAKTEELKRMVDGGLAEGDKVAKGTTLNEQLLAAEFERLRSGGATEAEALAQIESEQFLRGLATSRRSCARPPRRLRSWAHPTRYASAPPRRRSGSIRSPRSNCGRRTLTSIAC